MVMLQQGDQVTSILLTLKKREDKPPKNEVSQYSSAIRTLIAQWENLRVVDGLLYVVSEDKLTKQETFLLVAPAGVRQKVLTMSHDDRTAGHLGRDRTLASVKRHVYWPGMAEDVARWCRQCDMCARRKPGPGRAKLPMRHVNVGMPLERIAIDIMGPLPMSHDGYEYIMVVEDYYTKYAEAYCLVDHTARSVGDKLLTEFICRFGVPLTIHTDQGREFESHLFQHLCTALGADKTRTTPYHPQSDGMVERQNRTIQQMLSAYVNEQRDDWSDHLDLIMLAYRATVHQSTQCTPNLVMFGREINLPLTVELGTFPVSDAPLCPVEYVEWVKNTLEKVFCFVREQSEVSVQKQKHYHDQNCKLREVEPGDWVWRWYPPKAKQKLGLGWTGPYKVVKRVGESAVKIEGLGKTLVIHINDTKPYEGRNLPESGSDEPESSEDESEDESEWSGESDGERPIINTRAGRTVRPPNRYSPS
ncbi:hypothetical protein V1264_008778 [Littorina saxatilis]